MRARGALSLALRAARKCELELLLPLALLVAWESVHRLGLIKSHFLPSPGQVTATLLALVRDGSLLADLRVSLGRVLAGFFLGAGPGLVLGVALARVRILDEALMPILSFVRQVPIVGWLPLIVVWCGVGELSKVVFIAAGALFPVLVNTYDGVRRTPITYLEVARVFEYSRLQLFRRIVFPSALTSIVAGLRLSLGLSWMLVIGAELMIVSAGGIGERLCQGRDTFRMEIVIVTILVVGVVGLAMDRGFTWLESRWLRWRHVAGARWTQ